MGPIDWLLGKFGYAKLNRETVPAGTIEKEFGVQPAASRKMEDNINLWWSLYTNHPPWETCDVRPLGLPGSIGRELARHALTEFNVAVSGSVRAEYINRQVQIAVPKFCNDLEIGLCLGGVALKPYPDRSRILVEAYATGFTPTRFEGTGKCIGGVFRSVPVRKGKDWYIKLEYHNFVDREDGSRVYVVENRAFKSGKDGGIGAPVSLNIVEQWKGLSERTEIENLEGPLFAYFKPPMANQEEPNSSMGVSVYSGAVVDRIKEADEQWSLIRKEYRTGRRRMLFNGYAMSIDQVDDEFYEYGPFTSDTSFFQFINPEIRNSQFYEGLQYILKIIEFNVGLAFGTISDPQSVNKTATEEIMTKHRQYVTEDDIQKAFESTLDDLIYAMDAWCDIAALAPTGAYAVDYNWGDGVLDDPETRRQDMAMDIQRVNAGLMTPVAFVVKWDKVDEATARKMLPGMDELVTEEQEEIE